MHAISWTIRHNRCAKPSLLLCCANTASIVYIFCSLPCFASHHIEQVLYIESVGFLKFLSIIVAFYDTVSLHEACHLYPLHFSYCNHTECKPLRSPTMTRTSASTRTTTSNSRVGKRINSKSQYSALKIVNYSQRITKITCSLLRIIQL